MPFSCSDYKRKKMSGFSWHNGSFLASQFHDTRWRMEAVWPDCAIYWTLGKFLKPLATINLPKSPTLLGNFRKVVKIYHFSSKIILGTFGNLYLVTLTGSLKNVSRFDFFAAVIFKQIWPELDLTSLMKFKYYLLSFAARFLGTLTNPLIGSA